MHSEIFGDGESIKIMISTKVQFMKQWQNVYKYLFSLQLHSYEKWQKGVVDIQFNKIIVWFNSGKFCSYILNV